MTIIDIQIHGHVWSDNTPRNSAVAWSDGGQGKLPGLIRPVTTGAVPATGGFQGLLTSLLGRHTFPMVFSVDGRNSDTG